MSRGPEAGTGALVGVIAGLTAQGYTDRQIAAGLGLKRPNVTNYRMRYGIAAGQPQTTVYRQPRQDLEASA